MTQMNCDECKNCNKFDCRFDFRSACGAAGQEVDDVRDVWHCRDFEEVEETAGEENK